MAYVEEEREVVGQQAKGGERPHSHTIRIGRVVLITEHASGDMIVTDEVMHVGITLPETKALEIEAAAWKHFSKRMEKNVAYLLSLAGSGGGAGQPAETPGAAR